MARRSSRFGGEGVVLAALLALLLAAVTAIGCAPVAAPAVPPKNVIVLIGDGMGFELVRAAGMFANGRDGTLFMETLPHKAQVVTSMAYTPPVATTAPVAPAVTDSAAAASAYATGHKVSKFVLSVAIPGDGKPLPTAMEQFARQGKMTGLVTTSYLTDATPAAFGAHAGNRGMYAKIAADYFALRINVLLGGNNEKDFDLAAASAKTGLYELVTDRAALNAVQPRRDTHVLGIFAKGTMSYEYDYATGVTKSYDSQPHLSEMAAAALKIVSSEPEGFFLVIESGILDKACHAGKLERAVYEALEFDKTVKVAMQWASSRDDTLVIVLADHETAGLKVTAANGPGKMPTVTWGATVHTVANVPLYAYGPGSRKVQGTLDNTDIYRLIMGTFESPTKYDPPKVPAAGQSAPAPRKQD